MKGYRSGVVEINQNASIPNDPPARKVLVEAAGVNPADWKIREGGFQHDAYPRGKVVLAVTE